VQWDVSVGQATLLTLLIGVSTGIFATVIAAWLSLSVFWFRILGWRLALGLVSSFLLVPLYVQATAWSAGFGSHGWLRLSQVDASRNPWVGIASVVWIHSCAAIPCCFWIVALGLRRCCDGVVEQSMIEFGSRFTLCRVLFPRLKIWLLGSFLWAFSTLQYDMVVTNLFQVPTLCESVYQQVQFGKLRSVPIAIAWSVSIVCGLVIAVGCYGGGVEHQAVRQGSAKSLPSPCFSGLERCCFGLLGWLTLFLFCVVPWLSLISRMGFRSEMIQGRMVRQWSFAECLASLWHVQDFHQEFGWSFQLSLWSSGLSVVLASILLWSAGNRFWNACLFAFLGCMLTTPGPLINLGVGQLLNRWMPESLDFLSDRTLIGPILALQFRVLPVVFGLLWIARQQYLHRYGELMQLEKQLPLWMQYCSWIRFTQWAWLIAFLIGFFVAFGDLASYLLVQPPGVTTVAMRMFDLLHYGTKNREAGLAVSLALLGAVSSFLWFLVHPGQRVGFLPKHRQASESVAERTRKR